MARITTYDNGTAQGNDKFIVSDGTSNATENLTLSEVRSFITEGFADLPTEVPLGFAAVVKRDGTAIERSLYRIEEIGTPAPVDVISHGAVAFFGRGANNAFDFRETTSILTIRDRNDGLFALDYDLESFVGSTFTASDASTNYVGTITEFFPPLFNNPTGLDLSLIHI